MKKTMTIGLLALLLSACGGSGKVRKVITDEPTIAKKIPASAKERFDPSTLREPPSPIVAKKKKKTKNTTYNLYAGEAESEQDSLQIGYRIQLLQTEDAQSARDLQREIILQLDVESYLRFDNPYYKIRIGDFTTRFAAEEYLKTIEANGHSGGWIVRTKINTGQMLTDPRQEDIIDDKQ